MKRLLLLAALAGVFSVSPALAQHTTSGTLSWRLLSHPSSFAYTVQVNVAMGLRRDRYTGSSADGRPTVGDVITEATFDGEGTEAGTLSFGDGTSQPLTLTVRSIDLNSNWLYATASITKVYDSGPGPYTLTLSGCCTPSFNSYSIASLINLTVEPSSPVMTIAPVVYCQRDGTGKCTFNVLAATAEPNDVVRYRIPSYFEAGGLNPLGGLTVDPVTGVVTYADDQQNTFSSVVQIVAETFHTLNGSPIGNALSSTATQFLFAVVAGFPGAAPQFLAPGATTPAGGLDPACGSTVAMTPGRTFSHDFRGYTLNGDGVTLTAAGVPAGATFPSPVVLPLMGNIPFSADARRSGDRRAFSPRFASSPRSASRDSLGVSTFSWTPAVGQEGAYVISGIAFGTAGVTSVSQSTCSIGLVVYADADGDNIPDVWETSGYTRNGVFVDLKAMGANPLRKDVFVFIDGYTDPSDTLAQRSMVSPNAINTAILAFQNAPVTNLDGSTGIALHVVYGNTAIPYSSALPPLGGPNGSASFDWTQFNAIKAARFPDKYTPVFRYGLFYPYQAGPFPTSTGIAKGIPSSDFIVSLGLLPRTFHLLGKRTISDSYGGTDEQQAGTLLHELGHVLGLTHGGPLAVADLTQQSLAYKPNYLSVMNYAYQLTGLPTTTTPVFDYSQYGSTELPALNEQNLNETLGFQAPGPLAAIPALKIAARLAPIQRNLLGAWYCQSGGTRVVACRDASGVYSTGCNLNSPQLFSCGVSPQSSVTATLRLGATPGIYNSLLGYLDWAYLNFGGGATGFGGNTGPGLVTTTTDPHDPTPEVTIPPNPPTGLTARRTGTAVRVTWNPVGAINSFVYTLYKKVGSGAFTVLSTTTTSSANDVVVSGQTIQYYVTATGGASDGNGNSIASANSAIITVVVP